APRPPITSQIAGSFRKQYCSGRACRIHSLATSASFFPSLLISCQLRRVVPGETVDLAFDAFEDFGDFGISLFLFFCAAFRIPLPDRQGALRLLLRQEP